MMDTEAKYLLTTLWTQTERVISCGSNESLENGIDYNQYSPLDLYAGNGVRSYTGCAATAIAQVVYYHLLYDFLNEDVSWNIVPGSLTEENAYVSFSKLPALTVYVSADGSEIGGTPSFEEINNKLSTFTAPPTDPEAADYDLNSLAAADYIAALNFSVGVMLKSAYSNIFQTAAMFNENLFLRCGFESAHYVDLVDMDDTEKALWATEDEQLTDEAIEILVDNLEKGQPIVFGVPGHAIVLDGYDAENDLFHLNYGWGPEDVESDAATEDKKNTRWYTRDEFKKLGVNGFIIDISPEYQETFTVTDSRCFGSGTLFRVVQQTAAMRGDNIITLDGALAEAEGVELPQELELKDKTTLSGFNMTLFAAVKNDEENAPAEQDGEDSDGNEETKAEESVAAIFFGEAGSRTEFTDFSGRLICSCQEQSKGAALFFEEAVQLTLSTNNAHIYAGVTSFENADILESMTSGSLDELLEESQMKTAIAGSDGDDKIVLDNASLVIGNLDLSDGHDTLTVAGNSTVYGDIDMGSGDNKITLSAGSAIHGNLQGETDLILILTGSEGDVLFEITGEADRSFENILSITVDASNAEADEYILFNTGNLETLLEKLQLKGDGGFITAEDGSIRWSAGEGEIPEEEEKEESAETIVSAGQTVADAAVGAEEVLIFKDGSSATGSLTVDENGEVKVMTGASFIFDISSMAEENSNGIINNFSGINGTFHFSVKMAADQANGTYILAENVTEWGFNMPISVSAGDTKLGVFKNDEDEKGFTYGDDYYELVYDEEKKSLNLVIGTAFRSVADEEGSVELFWHNPVGAGGYFLELSRSDEEGAIKIFTEMNTLNIITATDGEYEWQVLAPGLETEYREGGTFEIGDANEERSAESVAHVYDASVKSEKTAVFIAGSSGTWEHGYAAQHVALPEGWEKESNVLTQVSLTGKNRCIDIFKGREDDASLLYLSDSENGDALFLDDIYSVFPEAFRSERLSQIDAIYAGGGDDIIDLTTDKFEFAGENVSVYGGNGDDVIWAGADTECCLFGDKGNDSLIGSSKGDCFIGGAGDDVMHGGGGTDVFAYGDPATWGNDIIYQLKGEGDSIVVFFEQSTLKDQIREEEIENGVCISVEGWEDHSITLYGGTYSILYGDECEKMETIYSNGGCGEAASGNIFENKNNGMLA